jgi:hypothetical protein
MLLVQDENIVFTGQVLLQDTQTHLRIFVLNISIYLLTEKAGHLKYLRKGNARNILSKKSQVKKAHGTSELLGFWTLSIV